MPIRRKGFFAPVLLVLMGIVALSNFASKPGFDAIRTVDVVRLVGAGMCFGAAIALFAMFLRDTRPD